MKNSSCLALVAATLAVSCIAGEPPRTLRVDGRSPEARNAESRVREVEQTLQAWKLAWELGDTDTYVRFYHPEFRGDAASRQHWEEHRRVRLANQRIALQLQDLRVRILTPTEAEVRFTQRYQSREHTDLGDKRIVLRRHGGAWLIMQERWMQHGAAGTRL